MKSRLLVAAIFLAVVGCGYKKHNDERLFSYVLNAYDEGHYDSVFKALSENSEFGSHGSLMFFAAEMYSARAYLTRDQSLASLALIRLREMESDSHKSEQADHIYNYLDALAYDALGLKRNAYDALARNCTSYAQTVYVKCKMLREIAARFGDRLDDELAFATSDIALKYDFNDPALPEIQISSLVRRDYASGHALKLKYVDEGKLTEHMSIVYCKAVEDWLDGHRHSVWLADDVRDCK